jgi:hypothetical protein
VNKLALRWVDTAMALAEENRQLRELMSALIVRIAANQDLLELARRELVERFPEEGPA